MKRYDLCGSWGDHHRVGHQADRPNEDDGTGNDDTANLAIKSEEEDGGFKETQLTSGAFDRLQDVGLI